MTTRDLKPSLLSILSPSPDRTQLRFFVEQCFRMAHVYLKRKAASGRLDPDFFGISLDDLALDCIADLFERDDDGRFSQLAAYFEPMDPARCTPAELTSATRRLVFSKVSEGLFRRYREADPSLAKTVRNLRYALRTGADARLTRRRRTLWVCFSEEASKGRPLMAEELLEARLMAGLQAGTDLKEVLETVGDILRGHSTYDPSYPLVALARIVRSAFERLEDAPEPATQPMAALYTEEITGFIQTTTTTLEHQMRPRYVGKKKVDAPTFEAYFDATRDILTSQCVADHPEHDSYYDHLQSHVSSLTYEEYREEHRTRLEYIVKLAREQFLDEISAHW